jgi:hypothetical protein
VDVVIRVRKLLPGGKWRWVTSTLRVQDEPEREPLKVDFRKMKWGDSFYDQAELDRMAGFGSQPEDRQEPLEGPQEPPRKSESDAGPEPVHLSPSG